MNGYYKSRVLWGLLLIGIGVIFLLDQYGLIELDIGYVAGTFWPVILIVIGLNGLLTREGGANSKIGNLILITIGGFFLIRNLDLIDMSFGDFIRFSIPILLILSGLGLLFRRNKRDDSSAKYPNESNAPEAVASTYPSDEEPPANDVDMNRSMNRSSFIGDIHIGQSAWDLKSMSLSNFIGDTVLDLTKAHIPEGLTKINISSFIGDVKIIVPADASLSIKASTSLIFGDIQLLERSEGGLLKSMSWQSDQSDQYQSDEKQLAFNISLFIGDVILKQAEEQSNT